MRIGIVVVLTALGAVCAWGQSGPASGGANDWKVVPGVRVGPVTASAVRADIRALFPQSTVADDELELEEGVVFPATWVARETPGESLAILWTGKEAGAHPKQVFICRGGRRRGACRWQTQGVGGDIATGMKLLDLEAMNGKPFTIHGFGWGYGGSVESWDDGKLGKLDCNHSLSIAIDGQRDREGEFTVALTEDERNSFSGNRSVSTTTPALRKLNPSVTEILFIFPPPGAKACAQ